MPELVNALEQCLAEGGAMDVPAELIKSFVGNDGVCGRVREKR